MPDFTPNIRRSFAIFPGIVEHPETVATINDLLNRLECNGFAQLVRNVTSRTGDSARDIMLEALMCNALLANRAVTNLVYEPEDVKRPPDFRCDVGDCAFDIQVKRFRLLGNEDAKQAFRRRCDKQLGAFAKPWFLHYWLSDDFQKKHIDPFLVFLRQSLSTIEPSDPEAAIAANQYFWPASEEPLLSFAVSECPLLHGQMAIGSIKAFGTHGSLMKRIDADAIREGVRRLLRKSSKTFVALPGDGQINLVVVQPAWELMICPETTMANVLYGDRAITFDRRTLDGTAVAHRTANGLFRSGKSSRISALLSVPHSWDWTSDTLEGTLFPHPDQLPGIWQPMQSFPGLQCQLPPGWEVSEQGP